MEAVGRVLKVALILGLVVTGCGDDGDNDNGISLRAVGFFQGEIQEGRCLVPTADDAIADPSITLALQSLLLDDGYPTGAFVCRGYLWLENNLFDQAVVVERLDFEYEIPGARIGIPANSAPVGIRINPANADPETQPSPFGPPNVYIGQPEGQIVPASLVLFLRQNQLSLPQLPYTMIVHVTALGRTDSGETMVSNEVRYTIQWAQDPR